MQEEATIFADPNDRASQESDVTIELRNHDKERESLLRRSMIRSLKLTLENMVIL